MLVQGPAWGHWGIGLSENSGAGLLYMAALTAMAASNWPSMVMAGGLAILAFYTRLNSLPMAFALAAFAIPVATPIRDLFRPARLIKNARVSLAIAIAGLLGLGIFLFALRTWHYTGVFSIFYGTQLDTLSVWQPGLSALEVVERMVSSLMMVLTMNDPPQFAWYAVPMLVAAAAAVGGLVGVKGLRDLPLPVVVLYLAACSGALVARSSAYSGRFSTALIAPASALTVCVVASLVNYQRSRNLKRLG